MSKLINYKITYLCVLKIQSPPEQLGKMKVSGPLQGATGQTALYIHIYINTYYILPYRIQK